MDNVLFGLGLLSAIGVIAFLVIAVVRIFKKKPRKNFVVAALICFVASTIFMFCGAQTNYNNMTPEERSEYDSKLAAESQLKEEKKASKDKSKDKNKTSEPPITEAAASQNIGDVSVQALKLYADLSDEQAQKVINDFKKVGISTPIYFESLSSNSTDKSFKFSNDKISGTLVVSNGKTSYISSGGVELFNSKKAEPSQTLKITISAPTSQIITRAWQNNMLSNTSRLHQPRRSPTSRIQAHGLYRAIKTPLRSAHGLTHKTPMVHCCAAIL